MEDDFRGLSKVAQTVFSGVKSTCPDFFLYAISSSLRCFRCFDSLIGDTFPLDGGSTTEGKPVTFRAGTKFSLRCPALSGISPGKGTLIWSYGPVDARSTTVIGTFNLPDGPKTPHRSKDNGCLNISMEGLLLLNNCSQDGDVRYWCHVFSANSNLNRSYILVKGKVISEISNQSSD